MLDFRSLTVLLLLLGSCVFHLSKAEDAEEFANEAVTRRSVVILADNNITAALNESPNWLIKFYTPWCKHCKKLNPVFQQLAEEAPDGVVIAQVDCTKQKVAAETYQVDRYPTIIYKQGSSFGTYEGPRDLHAFKRFVQRMVEPAYIVLDDVRNIPDNPATDHVTFALMADTPKLAAIGREESEERVVELFRRLSEKNKQDATFALVDMEMFEHSKDIYSEALHLVKFDHGKPVLFMPNPLDAAPADMEEFVHSNNYPLISIFDNHNFKRLSGLHKLIVIAVIDPRQEERTASILEIFDEQVHLMGHEAANYIFGHLDGIKWRSFIKVHHTLVPSVLVLDQDNDLHQSFYLNGVLTDPVKMKEEIASIFQSVRDHTISMEWNETLPPTMTQKILYRFKDYYPWSLIVVILPIIFVLMSFFTPYPKEKTKKH